MDTIKLRAGDCIYTWAEISPRTKERRYYNFLGYDEEGYPIGECLSSGRVVTIESETFFKLVDDFEDDNIYELDEDEVIN